MSTRIHPGTAPDEQLVNCTGAPLPGRTKTPHARLRGALGKARVAAELPRRTLATMRELARAHGCEIELAETESRPAVAPSRWHAGSQLGAVATPRLSEEQAGPVGLRRRIERRGPQPTGELRAVNAPEPFQSTEAARLRRSYFHPVGRLGGRPLSPIS